MKPGGSLKGYRLLGVDGSVDPKEPLLSEEDVEASSSIAIQSSLGARRRNPNRSGWPSHRTYEYDFITVKYITLGALLLIAILVILYFPLGSYRSDMFGTSTLNERLSTITGLSKNHPPRVFTRNSATSQLDCRRIMQHDTKYMAEMAKHRITYKDPDDLPMDCDSIKTRNYFPEEPMSQMEADYPLAQARIVYQDYRFLEMELAAGYAPQNWYCYAIDEKADKKFHERVHALAKCLPNIVTTLHEYKVDSGGHNMGTSFVECMKLLVARKREWKYVSLLQNHDITIRTNQEAVQVFQWLDGANDLEIRDPPGGRVNTSLDWSFAALRLFRNATRNNLTVNGFPPRLVFSKGYVECSLTRQMVEFLLDDLDLTEVLSRVEKQGYGTDEIMFPTLSAADALGAPGGFTRSCMDRGDRIEHLTRYSLWYDGDKCGTHHMRHAICLFGMEDLSMTLAHLPHLFANKMMPDFDFGAIDCWYEEMFHRTYLEEGGMSRMNATLYHNLPHVRFQSFKNKAKAEGRPLTAAVLKTFDCKLGASFDG